MLLRRPTSVGANWLKAWGEKLRSPRSHPSHRSINRTLMVLSLSVICGKD